MMEFDIDKTDRFVIKIDENKIEKFEIKYERGDLNIGKGEDVVSIPIDNIASVYKQTMLARFAMMHPIISGAIYLNNEDDSNNLDNRKQINKLQIQLLASKNEKKVIKEVEIIKSKGIDKVYYLKMKNGYYKVFIDSKNKNRYRKLLPKYSDSFLVRIEG